MNKEEVRDLRIGDIVVVSSKQSRNFGKRGTVIDILRFNYRANIVIKPLECEFVIIKDRDKLTKRENPCYSHYALRVENKIRKVKAVKPKLQIYQFCADIDYYSTKYISVISYNEEDALKILMTDWSKKYQDKNMRAPLLHCIYPIVEGTLI